MITKAEIEAEIKALEAEAQNIIAKSHVLSGSLQMAKHLLAKVEAMEQSAVADIKADLEHKKPVAAAVSAPAVTTVEPNVNPDTANK